MTDDLWKRDEIKSPCVKLCSIHPDTQLCLGCARSIAEITSWSGMSDSARAEIMAQLPSRSPAPKNRRGGRRSRVTPQRNKI